MFGAIRNKGNFEFNTNDDINDGQLIVIRRPKAELNRDATNFTICYSCYGAYSKTSTRQHICSRQQVKGDRTSVQLSRMVEGRIDESASSRLQTITSRMNSDPVSNLVSYDKLLIAYGNELVEQYDFNPHHKIVRSRLRLLGRVLVELKTIEPKITDFASLFDAQHCDSVINAIRAVGRFNATTRFFGAPSAASNAVTEIKKVGKIVINQCIANKTKELKEQTNDFITLFVSRSTIRINKLVANTLAHLKLNKIENVPTSGDVKTLSTFLSQKRKECYQLLHAGYSKQKFINLAEITMVSMILFSRKRVGEMENCTKDDYIKRERCANPNNELLVSLSADAKKRVQRYSRMKIRGKLRRPVPILLQSDVEKCLDLLLKYRDAAGITPENQLLFALPLSNPDHAKFISDQDHVNVINACNAVRKWTTICGATVPGSLRGTQFRKHFASFCATKEINENTMTDVSNFLGHSPLIHKSIYRGNELHREVARMSELLEEAAGDDDIDENEMVNDNDGSDMDIDVNEIDCNEIADDIVGDMDANEIVDGIVGNDVVGDIGQRKDTEIGSKRKQQLDPDGDIVPSK